MLLLIIVTSVVSGFIIAGGVFGVGSLFVRAGYLLLALFHVHCVIGFHVGRALFIVEVKME